MNIRYICGFDQFSTDDNWNANSVQKKMLALRALWSQKFFQRLISLYIYAFVTEMVELLLNFSRYKYILA